MLSFSQYFIEQTTQEKFYRQAWRKLPPAELEKAISLWKKARGGSQGGASNTKRLHRRNLDQMLSKHGLSVSKKQNQSSPPSSPPLVFLKVLKWSATKRIDGLGETEWQSRDGRFIIRINVRLINSPYAQGPFGYELIDRRNRDNYWGNLNSLEDAKDEAEEILDKERRRGIVP